MNFDIPERFRSLIRFVYCKSCNNRLNDAVFVSVGLTIKGDKHHGFFEVQCAKCHQTTRVIIGTHASTLGDLARLCRNLGFGESRPAAISRNHAAKGKAERLLLPLARVAECSAGLLGSRLLAEKVGLLMLETTEGRPLSESALSVAELRKLALAVIAVLERHDDPIGKKLAQMCDDQGVSEIRPDDHSMPGAPPAKRRQKRVAASVRPSLGRAPKAPLSGEEAWRLIQMTRHCRSHDDFMRFIGGETAPEPKRKKPSKRKRRKAGGS